MNLKLQQLRIFIFCLSLLVSGFSYAQTHKKDSTEIDLIPGVNNVEDYRTFLDEKLARNQKRISDKQQMRLQKQKVNELKSFAKETADFLNNGIDTKSIIEQLDDLDFLYKLTNKGIKPNINNFYSYRSLEASNLLFSELDQKLENLNKPLQAYLNAVYKKTGTLDSLTIDSALYQLPADSSLFIGYEKSHMLLLAQVLPVDSLLNSTYANLKLLEYRSRKLKANINDDRIKAEMFRKKISKSIIKQEMPSVFSLPFKPVIFSNQLSENLQKSYYTTLFFIQNKWSGIFVLIALVSLVYIFFLNLRKKIRLGTKFVTIQSNNEILQFPFLASLFIVLNFAEFFIEYPPFVIQGFYWLLLSFVLLVLHKNDPLVFGSRLWLYLLVLFLIVTIDNTILETSLLEVLFIILVCIANIIFSIVFMRHLKQYIANKPIIKWIIYCYLFIQIIAFIAIVFGRYNLCKTLFKTSYFALISGVFLYWTYHLVVKALTTYSLSIETENKPDFLSKLKQLHDKTPGRFSIIFVVGWLILFIRNFYVYTFIVAEINQYLITERTIGKYSYSIESILVFVFIIFLSGLLSRLLSIMADNSYVKFDGPVKKKGGLGNWLLLMRLATIILGVVLAFAAAGIPMNQLTIIIGSLGLGIGFGLQNIVGNLISGVVLAFERPFEIGDQIEVAGKLGRVKSIGIRSSQMTDLDGAEVIIPNSDLLNQHVINWTLSNSQRRVEIIVGVKFGTDLNKTKKLLDEIIFSNSHVERKPFPEVFLQQFNNSSIDFRMLFWTDINIWQRTKSEIILSIDKSFSEAGIEIPFPQQDIYIKEMPDKSKSKSE